LYLSFQIFGTSLKFSEALGLIILPNLLINLLIALPVYYMVRDLAHWVNLSQEDE
jgi:hypothetical protein